MRALRSTLAWAFRRVLAIYFRSIEVIGDAPAASTGGRIFAANHVNGLVDPILVLTRADCPICPVAKSTLWKIPGLRWLLDAAGAVPVVRRRDDPAKAADANDAAFERVGTHLRGGGNILIFPEGTSHNEPRLSPLRSGAGHMLAAAHAGGASGLTFQAVGLEFDARDTFRSRALVLFGPVRRVDALQGALAAGADEQDRAGRLARAVTAQLHADLSELVVEAATWDERLLIARVAELFVHEGRDRALSTWSSVGRAVEAAKESLRATSPPVYDAIATRVARYYAMLAAAGETDERVAQGGDAPARTTSPGGLLARVAWAPLAAAGFLLYALPYRVPRLVARLAGKETDVVSTYKLAAGLMVFPLWAMGLVAASLAWLPSPLALLGAAIALISPFAALDALDRLDTPSRSGLLRSQAPPAGALAALRQARAELRGLLDEARAGMRVDPPPPSARPMV